MSVGRSGRPFALIVLVVLASCAEAPRLLFRSEQQALERRLLELERQATRSRLELDQLKRRLADVERRGDLPRAGVALEAAPAAEPDSAPARASIEIEASDLAVAVAPSTGGSATASEYEAALAALAESRFEEAEERLLRFAVAAPPDLGDNAWFWIGEARAARGDAPGAITAYRTALDRYPEGNKAPDALLKLGNALAQGGDAGAAAECWSELVRRFPATAAAEAARSRLGE